MRLSTDLEMGRNIKIFTMGTNMGAYYQSIQPMDSVMPMAFGL